ACGAIAYTAHREFTIYPDLVSQNIVPSVSGAVCAGTDLSATFSEGGGGVPGIFNDVYELSTNGGSTWSTYTPGNTISTTGLSGNNIVRIRTQRVSSGVDGCNDGAVVTFSWTINALPAVTASAAVCVGSTITLSPTTGGTWASSNTAVATVTNAGVVTGIFTDNAIFTGKDTRTNSSNTTSSWTINALPVVTASAAVCVGSTITLSPTSGGTWTSSNTAVATVTNAGVVTG